jgi:mono/diheme cytochrome c family protein
MRLWLLVAVTFSLIAGGKIFAEDHATTDTSKTGRAEQAPKTESKLFDYVSACMAGRPVGADVGSLNLTPNLSTPPTQNSVGSSPSSASASGEAVFRNSCLGCHSGSSGPPNLTLLNGTSAQKSIVQIQNGNMPKGKTLTPAEKESLLTFLQSKQ